MFKFKKVISFFLLIMIGITSLGNVTNAGWLDIPENIDAKGLANQMINQYLPTQNIDYQGNITNLIKAFNNKEISYNVKDNFTNALVSNINYQLSDNYGDSYGYAQLEFTPEETEALKEAGLYDSLSNFTYIELDYDFLKTANLLSPAGYTYFKDTLYPLLENDLKMPNKKFKEPQNVTVGKGYNALIVPKQYDELKIFFDDYYNKIKDRVIAFGLPGDNLLFVSVPKKSSLQGSIVSSLTLTKAEGDYLINGKIKYPKELKVCMDKIDGNAVNSLGDLSSQLQSVPECKALLETIKLDCSGEPEFVGNFSPNTINQFIGVYGLEESDGFFLVVIIKREFQRNLIQALPSSTYNSSSQCGYNLLMSDNLSINLNGQQKYSKGTKKIIYSSRDNGFDISSCDAAKYSLDNGTLIYNGAGDFTNSCDLATFSNDFINSGYDLGINFGLYQTGSLNQDFTIGFKDSSGNIKNYWVAGKNIGNGAINLGVESQNALGFNFNNSREESGVKINNYWNNYIQIYRDINGKSLTNQKVRNSQVYEYKIDGANSGAFTDTLVVSSNFKSINGAGSYDIPSFNRYNKLFITQSGSTNDLSQVSFIDVGYNVPTKYYIFSKKTTVDNVQTLNLQQTLDLEGFAFFKKDIGLTTYSNGDNLQGFNFTFSGSLDNNYNRYIGDPIKNGTNKIDFDVLRYNYGTLDGGLGIYKEVKHLKLVYDNSKDLYVFKDSDVAPFTSFETNNLYIGGFLGGVVKDCTLVNFVADDLEGCSHGALKPINIDNDSIKVDSGGSYVTWPEWIYSNGSELRIFNNVVKKDQVGNYTVNLEELFYNNNLTYCTKQDQNAEYYNGKTDDASALVVTENNQTYKGYSPDYTKGISFIFKDGDYKFIYGFDGNNWYDKKYSLTQVIQDTNGTIICD